MNNNIVDHIIHMTRVQPFGFLCSEAISAYARLVKRTQVFLRGQHGLPSLYMIVESITPDHHVVLRNDELSQRCILRGEHFILILVLGIIL